MLNYLWSFMILTGIVYAAFTGRMPDITNAALDSSKEAISLCITMIGVMSFWVGLMEIASKAGIIPAASRKIRPVIRFLFPNLPAGHPAEEPITTNMIANMLGLTNCFADVTGWGEISEEQVLERNPDYIVTISMYYGEGPTPEEEILSRTGWENVTAVKNGKILNLPNNELSRPAPRLADGAKALYDFVYGE